MDLSNNHATIQQKRECELIVYSNSCKNTAMTLSLKRSLLRQLYEIKDFCESLIIIFQIKGYDGNESMKFETRQFATHFIPLS